MNTNPLANPVATKSAKPAGPLTARSRRRRLIILLGFSLPIFVGILLTPPIAQNLNYHDFADQRPILGIPHMWNVMSNLPFAVIGVMGCWWLFRQRDLSKIFVERWELAAYLVFFIGEFLTCFGSAYYHADPNNHTLVWDRLVFSLLLTSFFTIVVTEFVSKRAGRIMLAPMVLLGLYSVWHWYASELAGQGDLRVYIVVQFYPVIAIPFIIWMFPSRYGQSRPFLLLWALFGLAKICELLDAPIYELSGFWSGHTFKHLIAAATTYCVLYALRRRNATPSWERANPGSGSLAQPSGETR